MLKPFLLKLCNRQDLSSDECQQVLQIILAGQAEPMQIAAFLALLQAKPVNSTELLALVQGMQDKMLVLSTPHQVLDIVGTGGDGANTINISTAASIVAASCGAKLAKHGNRAVSSQSGSADVLMAMDIRIDMDATKVAECIDKIGIGFCFAPLFHPAMAAIKSVRQALKIPTAFNLIGPLLNPARAKYFLLGVSNPSQITIMAEVLSQLKVIRAFVVHSAGLDELSLIGPTTVADVSPVGIKYYTLDAGDFGFTRAKLEDIQGKDANYNKTKIIEVFNGVPSALADTIVFNAGAALYIAEIASSIKDGIEIAQSHIHNGKTMEILRAWQQLSKF